MNKTTKSNLITYGIVIGAYIIVEILMLTGNLSSHMKGLLVPMTYYAVIAVALNLCVGILGELSIGQIGRIGRMMSRPKSGSELKHAEARHGRCPSLPPPARE